MQRHPAILAASLSVIIACSGSSSPPANPGGSGNPVDGPLRGLAITPQLDPDAAVTQLVEPAGGTLFLTASDGTSFTLRIPADALLSPTEIRMKPVAAIPDLPLTGGLVAGVRLEPEGLTFQAPATLTIYPPSFAVSTTQATAFGYHRAGEGFHLVPATVSGSSVTIPIMHFSGAGFGNATQQDVDAQSARETATPADGYEQQLASVIDGARQQGRALTDAPVQAQLEAVFTAWWTEQVLPALRAAETDDTRFDAAATGFFRWDRQRAFLGFPAQLGDPASAGQISLTKGLKNAFQKANDKCQAGDPLQVPAMLRRGKQALLLGLDIGYTADQTRAMARKCARFEITFDSSTRMDVSDGRWSTAQVRAAAVVAQVDANLMWLEGAGPLDYLSYGERNPQNDAVRATLTAGQVQLDRSSVQLDVAPGALPVVTLRPAITLAPVEDVTYVGASGSQFHLGPSFVGWSTIWAWAHRADLDVCVACAAYAPEVAYTGFGGTPSALRVTKRPVNVETPPAGLVWTYGATDVVDVVHRPLP